MTLIDSHGADLVRAFEKASLAALHVDMQDFFYDENRTAVAFSPVSDLANRLRTIDVPNFWVALTHRWHTGRFSDYQNFYENTMFAIHHTIKPSSNEIVFEKTDQNLFQPRGIGALNTLRRSGIDTLLVTGIYHDKCFADTVRGALGEGFRIYAVADATDCPMADFDFMPRNILKPLPVSMHRRLSLTSTPIVKQLLPEPAAASEKLSLALA